MRKIIERIAHEKSCNEIIEKPIQNVQTLTKRDRCCSSGSDKFERNFSAQIISTADGSVKSSGDTESDEIKGSCDKEGDQDGGELPLYYCVNQSLSQKHLCDCLLYWRENLYPANIKA